MTAKREAFIWMLLLAAKLTGLIIIVCLWSFAISWLVNNNYETIGMIVWASPMSSVIFLALYKVYLDKVKEINRYQSSSDDSVNRKGNQ